MFESSSLTQQTGVFQMIPCIANGPNKIDLGLYHRQFRLYRSAPQFLFAQEQVRESREQMALLTFNTLYYAQFREKVKKRSWSNHSRPSAGCRFDWDAARD